MKKALTGILLILTGFGLSRILKKVQKENYCPKGYLCSTNATVVKTQKLSPKSCEVILKTEQGKIVKFNESMACWSKTPRLDLSNEKVEVFFKDGKVVAINWSNNIGLTPRLNYPWPPQPIPNLP